MKISVIIPTYNRAYLLSEIIDSIYLQSYNDIEICVIDDGSTDNTNEIIKELKSKYCPDAIELRYFKQENQGAQRARNHGIEVATGDALLFADSDDLFASDGMSELASTLKLHPHIQFAYGKVKVTGMDIINESSDMCIGSPFEDTDADLVGYHWHTMGPLYRRGSLEKIGYWNEQLPCSQDWEYQIRAKLFGGTGKFVDTLVGYWRQHQQDRIGLKGFREDYTKATEILFHSIHKHAITANRNSPVLEYLLFRRLLGHAVFAGANDRKQIKCRLLDLACQIRADHTFSSIIFRCLRFTPTFIDKIFIQVFGKAYRSGAAGI